VIICVDSEISGGVSEKDAIGLKGDEVVTIGDITSEVLVNFLGEDVAWCDVV
jgi:hypothetical protein